MLTDRLLCSGPNKESCAPLYTLLLSATQHPSRWDLFFSLPAAEAQRDLVVCMESNS